MSQADQVISHINKWGSINSIEAIRNYGITRLARVINDLKGTPNQMKSVNDVNSEGKFVKYIPDLKGRAEMVISAHISTLDHPNLPTAMKIQSCLEAAAVLTNLQQEGL